MEGQSFTCNPIALLLHQLLIRGWNIRKGERRVQEERINQKLPQPLYWLSVFSHSRFFPVFQALWGQLLLLLRFIGISSTFILCLARQLPSATFVCVSVWHLNIIGSLLLDMDKDARNICDRINGDNPITDYFQRGITYLCLLAFPLLITNIRERSEN